MSFSSRGAGPAALWLFAGLVSTVVLASCATTRQTGRATASGFLEDYTILRAGGEGEPQLIWANPDKAFSSYRAVLIDSVTVWRTESTSQLSREDQQRLADHLYAALHEELSKSFAVAKAPGPGTLRVRAAITEAKGAKVVGNAVTTVLPQFRALSTAAGLATNTQVFVGKAAIEVELRDSLSNELLVAGVDERAGGKTLRGVGGAWKDVEAAFDTWAQGIRTWLDNRR